MSKKHLTFPCGKLSLEGFWHPAKGVEPLPVVVVCHPHPLYGGDMDNNVVMAVCEALVRQSIHAFRFNFRGVGGSEGSFDQGIGEQEDTRAALAFVSSLEEVNQNKIGLTGYSFGATVALPVALQEPQVEALALISPPLSIPEWESLTKYTRPKLLLVGARDSFVSAEELQRLAPELPQPVQYQIIPQADHFWWGKESSLSQAVSAFFAAVFK